ncbi:MAG: hypothetical protein DYG93_01530 [Leptolyngbya sp. PLA2]|nr:hypothetical protein [Leptolyngbya sp. PL-A2]MCQ3941273.1 hypothetical protein [cyanobacterium CYA1]MCZ7632813.1 hypothetical protein [Phycisphaerales bacterium]MDL1904386.1 hypothetical protein [Synechococcales cyanobacterium CNB]GIK19114.1 MAG: hypothetical protein BroJett004_12780 [Planctomycetota bacterium]
MTADTPPAAETQRVAMLTGDRLCAACGFNLHGQTIVREPHYGMLIVRCPECSGVAALQEYPSLGRWAGRWAGVLAGVWLLLMLGLWTGSAGIISGTSFAVSEAFTRPAALKIASAFVEWASSEDVKAQLTARNSWATNQTVSHYTWLDEDWLKEQDVRALTAGSGGLADRYDPRAAKGWIGVGIAAFVIGCFWSVALLHAAWHGRAAVAVAIVALAALFDWMAFSGSQTWGAALASDVARKAFGGPVLAATLVFSLLPLLAGMALGRRIARLAVRALLPPRLRGPLAFLWFCDGLTAPKTRHEFRLGA